MTATPLAPVGEPLTSAALETLIALVEVGPLWDGDVPSKQGRDELLRLDYARKIIVKGEDGFQAATYKGRDAYEDHFGNATSIAEARANRLARRVFRSEGAPVGGAPVAHKFVEHAWGDAPHCSRCGRPENDELHKGASPDLREARETGDADC